MESRQLKMNKKDEILLTRLVRALERIASTVIQDYKHRNRGVLQMKDIDRAKVYSKHLGKKLQKN
jgi:hypothetical protein